MPAASYENINGLGLVDYAKKLRAENGMNRLYFDFDLTLFRSMGYISSSKWFENVDKEYGFDKARNWWGWNRDSHERRQMANGFFFRRMDDELPRMLKEFKEAGFELVGLTAREPAMDEQRTREILDALDMHFEKIIFTNGSQNKAGKLDEFELANDGGKGKVNGLYIEDSFKNLKLVLPGRPHISGIYYHVANAGDEDNWDSAAYVRKGDEAMAAGNTAHAFEYYFNAVIKAVELAGITREQAYLALGEIYKKLEAMPAPKPAGYDQLHQLVEIAKDGRSYLFNDEAGRALRAKNLNLTSRLPDVADNVLTTSWSYWLGEKLGMREHTTQLAMPLIPVWNIVDITAHTVSLVRGKAGLGKFRGWGAAGIWALTLLAGVGAYFGFEHSILAASVAAYLANSISHFVYNLFFPGNTLTVGEIHSKVLFDTPDTRDNPNTAGKNELTAIGSPSLNYDSGRNLAEGMNLPDEKDRGTGVHKGKRTNELETVEINGKQYIKGYKIVTEGNQSLGLKENPNVFTFSMNKWNYLPKEWVEAGNRDWGGVWVNTSLSQARALQRYMWETYKKRMRLLEVAVDRELYSNDDSLKTNAIYPINEIKDSIYVVRDGNGMAILEDGPRQRLGMVNDLSEYSKGSESSKYFSEFEKNNQIAWCKNLNPTIKGLIDNFLLFYAFADAKPNGTIKEIFTDIPVDEDALVWLKGLYDYFGQPMPGITGPKTKFAPVPGYKASGIKLSTLSGGKDSAFITLENNTIPVHIANINKATQTRELKSVSILSEKLPNKPLVVPLN